MRTRVKKGKGDFGGRGVLKSRPPLIRMQRIHEILSSGKVANCARLSREMEVSAKTVQRDLEYMRDQMELPIEYNASERTYYYARPVRMFPALEVAEGDLLAFFIARESLDSYAGGKFGDQLRKTFAKLTSRLPDSVVFEWESLATRFDFRQPKPSGKASSSCEKVSRAVMENKRLRFKYQGLRDARSKERTIQPYQIRYLEGGWYVLGWDEVRRDWRVFALPRMSYVKVLVQSFERDADFDAELFWSGSLGVYRAGEKEKVVLRFRDWAARVAAEREWHVSQKVRQVGGGEVEITLLVQITPDLLRWIFSWADAVEVRSPKHLRDEYRRIAQRMVEG